MIANLPSSVIAREFGLSLFAARIDPSDPDDCLNYLMMHFGERWREIIVNQKAAMDYAGQMYINAAIAAPEVYRRLKSQREKQIQEYYAEDLYYGMARQRRSDPDGASK